MPDQPNQKRSHGTGTVIEKNGSVHVSFRPSPGARLVSRKVCRIGDLTKTQIEARVREIIHEYKPPADDSVLTFGKVAEMHIRELETLGRAKSYTRNRWRQFRNYLKPALGDRPITEITVKEMRAFQRTLLQKGIGIPTVRTVMVLASGIFNYGKGEELCALNPAADVKKPQETKTEKKTRYLSLAEVKRVIAAIPDDLFGPTERVMYKVAQLTGMRRSELLAFRWKNIEWETGNIWIVEGIVEGEEKDTKGHKGRSVPLTEDLAKILDAWSKESLYSNDGDLVFGHPATGKPLKEGTTSKRFKRALIKAEVGAIEMREYKVKRKVKGQWVNKTVERPFSDLCLHDLRHSFASYLAMAGVPLREIQEAAGHASAATTEQYAHLVPDDGAAERFGNAFKDAEDLLLDSDPIGEIDGQKMDSGSTAVSEIAPIPHDD